MLHRCYIAMPSLQNPELIRCQSLENLNKDFKSIFSHSFQFLLSRLLISLFYFIIFFLNENLSLLVVFCEMCLWK